MELQLSAYRQLKYEERVKLAEMKQNQHPLGQIAEALNRSKATISRELHRTQAPLPEVCSHAATVSLLDA